MARKGDGLFQRGGKHGTWWLDCRINGKRHVLRIGKRISRSAAADIADVKRAGILKGEVGIRKRKNCTFEKAKAAFLEWAGTNKRPRTLRTYRQQVERLAVSFGTKTLADISSLDVERHKRSRLEVGARIQANREISILKNLVNRCIEWKMFEGTNPCLGVKFLEEPKKRLRYLEPSEEAKLLEVSDEPLRSLIIVGTNTGIRIAAEALPLKWADVDLIRGILTVQAAYSKNGETRNIPLNSRVKEAFRNLKSTSKSEYVFSKPNGAPYKSMDKLFTSACKYAGLAGTGLSLHSLRHTFASSLVMAGVDLVTVQQYGGWSDLSLVQRYAHLSPGHKARAIEKIAERFQQASNLVTLAEHQGAV